MRLYRLGIYKHLKSGRFYKLLGVVYLESTGEEMAHYCCMNHPKQWVRPWSEFIEKFKKYPEETT